MLCLLLVLRFRGGQGKTLTYYAQGFPVGFKDTSSGTYYVNNHVHMVVEYHVMDETQDVSGCGEIPPSVLLVVNSPIDCLFVAHKQIATSPFM